MEAGSDTTASQALDFMMALLAFPDVLKKAQEEVDRICGTSRLPTLDDRDQMPYLEACVNEVRKVIRRLYANLTTSQVLRWRPPLPYGAPHLLMKGNSSHSSFYYTQEKKASDIGEQTTGTKVTSCPKELSYSKSNGKPSYPPTC